MNSKDNLEKNNQIENKNQQDIDSQGLAQNLQKHEKSENEKKFKPEAKDKPEQSDAPSNQDQDYDDQLIEEMFDEDNDEIQNCKIKKTEMLENQDQNALEELIQEYGIDNVCFDCIVGFTSKKAYAQHMRQEHAEEAYQQGLGKFLCKYCNTLLFSKRNLLTHMKKQYNKNMKKKQLTVRQQKFVNSFSTQSEKKSQILRIFIEKKKMNK